MTQFIAHFKVDFIHTKELKVNKSTKTYTNLNRKPNTKSNISENISQYTLFIKNFNYYYKN